MSVRRAAVTLGRRAAVTAALLAMHAVQGCGGDTREGGNDTVAAPIDSVTADSLPAKVRWNTRVLQNTDPRFRPAGWSDDSTLWGLVRDSITRVDVNTGVARSAGARGWALQAAPGVVSWHNEDGAWMMAEMSAPKLLPLHNGIAPTHVLWSRDGRRAILAWEDEGRAHQEIFQVAGDSRALDVQIQGYYGDRAVLWLDSTRVVLEIVASSGKNGATGYKESGWRGDLAILDVQSGKYQRVTDADDGQYLRVAGPNGQGILVTQWGAGRTDEHWLYDVDRWTRTSTSVPRGRAFSSHLGAVVVLVDADNDSSHAILLTSVDPANADGTRKIPLGRVARDVQPLFSPSGAIGSVHTSSGTVLIVRDEAPRTY